MKKIIEEIDKIKHTNYRSIAGYEDSSIQETSISVMEDNSNDVLCLEASNETCDMILKIIKENTPVTSELEELKKWFKSKVNNGIEFEYWEILNEMERIQQRNNTEPKPSLITLPFEECTEITKEAYDTLTPRQKGCCEFLKQEFNEINNINVVDAKEVKP